MATLTADTLARKWTAIARNTGGYLNLSTKQVGLMGALVRETDPTTVVRTHNGYLVVGTQPASIRIRGNRTAILALEAR